MTVTPVTSTANKNLFQKLPKAELHVHLEGSIEPATLVELAARHGVPLTLEEAASRYTPGDFAKFIEAFKWVTSLLRVPDDYALIAHRFAESLQRQNVLYAEVTLSIGVMLLRKQDVRANFNALREATSRVPGVHLAWIFDAVRQWGAESAMEVVRTAIEIGSPDIVAFGIGGDELAFPAADFRRVYEYAGRHGLHKLMHAGEIGGPESVREAVEILGVERIGHGIAVMRDERTMDFLAARNIPLELCPTSNLRTGALARQIDRESAGYDQHPLPFLYRRGLPVTISSDDPAMFETTVSDEYRYAHQMNLSSADLLRIAEASFQHAFLSKSEKQELLDKFHSGATPLSLL
jgi:aminodeoxyfutalosine deaminase